MLKDVVEYAALISPAVGFIGVALTLAVNGARAERERRRQLRARAVAAAVAYNEMPYSIRRRRHEAEHRSAERVRLDERFSTVQAELETCRVLVAADGNEAIAAAYERLVSALRAHAGAECRSAWADEPAQTDAGMNMPELHERLAPVRAEIDAFRTALSART